MCGFLQVLRQQNLLGQQAPGPVKLGQERRQDLLCRLSPGGEDLQVPPGQLAPLEVEDGHAAADLAGVQAQDVGVRQKTRHDLLPLAQQGNGFQPIPQGGGPLELQGLGGFLHLLPHCRYVLRVHTLHYTKRECSRSKLVKQEILPFHRLNLFRQICQDIIIHSRVKISDCRRYQ
mgnify:CR=1 FL=1